MTFGHLLLELLMDEFDYIFTKDSVFTDNENHIYINVKFEYLSVLSGVIFNQIKCK